jgi:hypothetical protein
VELAVLYQRSIVHARDLSSHTRRPATGIPRADFLDC